MPPRYRILICRGPECGDRRGSEALYGLFKAALHARDLDKVAEIGWQACFGRCSLGPNVLVRSVRDAEPHFTVALVPTEGGAVALYNHVTERDVGRIVDEHVKGGTIVRDLVFRPTREEGDPR